MGRRNLIFSGGSIFNLTGLSLYDIFLTIVNYQQRL
jgi:hypothetical protein